MTDTWGTPIGRARDDLHAARVLLDAGLASQAVSRACAASLQAARAALSHLDEFPGTEAGVVSAFGRHVVGRGGIRHEHGRTLRQLYEDRDGVENALLEAPASEARKAIAAAEALVEACADLTGKRRDGATPRRANQQMARLR
jgi:uncharacterized protein (UPF0332 family)